MPLASTEVMMSITTCSQRQLERTEAIRNSSIMANKNSTPSRAPTVAIEAGGEPQRDYAGHLTMPGRSA